MAKLKRLEGSALSRGWWFVVPLRVEGMFVLGLTIAIPRRSTVEAAFFGPFDHLPTLDDAAQVDRGDAIELRKGETHVRFHGGLVVDGSFPILGPVEGLDVESWFQPPEVLPVAFGRWIDLFLTLRLVPGWVPPMTDPVQLSSWFCVEDGKTWLAATVDGSVEFLYPVFAEVEQSPVPVSRELCQVGLGAVELAARVVTIGRWGYGRMGELPELTHGVGRHFRRAGTWASHVPEAQQRDRALMARLAVDAERVLDRLLEHGAWVAELRSGDAAVWDPFAARVAALRVWLRAEWVLPKTWAQTLAEVMGSLDKDLADDVGDDEVAGGERFVPRPVPSGVDASKRLAEMSWYQFDDVADWAAGALQAGGFDAVRAALDAALVDGSGGALSIGVGLAAADIVARFASGDEADTTQGPVERRVRDWVSSNRDVAIDVSDIERARHVLDLARHGEMAVEIDELDDESRSSWASLLDSISRRLDSA
jgi:hypothetical protein